MEGRRRVLARLLLPDFSFTKGKELSYISFVVEKTNSSMVIKILFLSSNINIFRARMHFVVCTSAYEKCSTFSGAALELVSLFANLGLELLQNLNLERQDLVESSHIGSSHH